MAIRLHPTWQQAIELHKRGYPRALLDRLAGADAVPAEARAYLALIVKKHAPKPRGRPASFARVFRAMEISSEFSRAYVAAKLERMATGRKARGQPSPYDVAIERTAKKFRVSQKTVERCMDLPPIF